MGELNKLSAFDAANGIRTKRFTSQQLMADCISRIEKCEMRPDRNTILIALRIIMGKRSSSGAIQT